MKDSVDKDLCIGCEYCVSVCPKVFSMDGDGKAEAVAGELSQEVEECANDAATNCPVGAITLK